MRTDKNLDKNILESKDWLDDKPDNHLTYNVFETIEENGEQRVIMHSLSGWERNHLFMNRNGKYEDVSLISGMDTDCDSRAHCILDINRDGYSDVAVVNGNNPQLQLFQNRLGEIDNRKRNFVAVHLVGGNATSQPSEDWSCRDAVGTLLTAFSGERKYVRELRFGEGFAGQNSTTLILGADGEQEMDLEVRWLSGKTQRFENVAVGQLATIYENPAESSSETGCDLTDYLNPDVTGEPVSTVTSENSIDHVRATLDLGTDLSQAQFHLVTSMATWCPSCKRNAPQVRSLRTHYGEKLGLIGLPMDSKDTAEMLDTYTEKQQPAYEILITAEDRHRDAFSTTVTEARGKTTLPSSILMDDQGVVVKAWLGVPTISEVAVLIEDKIHD